MRNAIRSQDDFWAGCLFIALGGSALFLSLEFGSASSAEMGPAYFPSVLGAMLAGVGILAVVRSLIRRGVPVSPVRLKAVLPVLAGVLLFAALLRTAGLAPVVVALVLTGGLASVRFRPLGYLLLGIFLAIFSSLLFVKRLGLPMPVFGTWFGL